MLPLCRVRVPLDLLWLRRIRIHHLDIAPVRLLSHVGPDQAADGEDDDDAEWNADAYRGLCCEF
jgi:hypothetical protein